MVNYLSTLGYAMLHFIAWFTIGFGFGELLKYFEII